MNSEEYRKALQNMHNLVDDLEDVTMENKILAQENVELEKDVEYIAEQHNETVNGIRELANNSRGFRIGKAIKHLNNCENMCEKCRQQEMQQANQCMCEKCRQQEMQQEQLNGMNVPNMMDKIGMKLNMLKSKMVFIVALILVGMLAVGASPSNAINWQTFVDLYIEFICNPATMAMFVTLIILLYKGIVKKNKK